MKAISHLQMRDSMFGTEQGPSELQLIQAGDSPAQSIDKVNRCIRAAADARKTAVTKSDLKLLTERVSASLKEIREGSIAAYRPPVGQERHMLERYSTVRDQGGAPRIRMYGGTHYGEHVPGLLDDPVSCGLPHQRVKRWAQNAALVSLVRCRPHENPSDPGVVRKYAPKSVANLNHWMRQLPGDVRQRIFTDSSGTGEEFIPTVTLPEVVSHAALVSAQMAAGLFPTDPMSTNTVTNPFAGTGLTPYLMGQATTDDPSPYRSSSMETDSRQRTAKKWGGRSVVDADADEDSIVDSRQVIIQTIARAMALGRDDLIFNGDSTATHGDTGIANWNPRGMWSTSLLGSSVDHRRAYIGLRHRALDIGSDATKDMSTWSATTLLALKAQLEPPHGASGDLVLFCPEEVLIANIIKMEQVATLEKYGPGASVLTGEVARLFGMRVVPTHMMTKDLNASGIYDNSTKTKGSVLIANVARHRIGVRKDLVVETDKDIIRGIHHIVASRRDILWTPDSSTTRNVVYGYNIG